MGRHRHEEPAAGVPAELRLLAAVLSQAVADCRSTNRQKRHIRREAVAWVHDGREAARLAVFLGLDPDGLLQQLRQAAGLEVS